MASHEFQIALDGPAASGKSTVARLVAQKLGGYYINTGDMYRTVTWVAQCAGVNPATDTQGVIRQLAGIQLGVCVGADRQPALYLNGQPVPQDKIRAPEVAAGVSYVARIAEVRAWLLERQRETRHLGIIVMEGRDIGTVVFPEATCKFFITASAEVRARRRLAQAGETTAGATVASVAAEIAARDRLDSTRAVAPLCAAPDAVTICTDDLTAEQVAERIVAAVRDATRGL